MNLRTAIALLVVAMPAAAYGQDSGATIGGSVAAANMDSHTDLAFTGSFGYRFTRVFGMEIEVTAAPDLTSSFSNGFPIILDGSSVTSTGGSLTSLIFPGPSMTDFGGRMVVFTNNARIEIPTTAARVTPFFVAGGGIASTRRTAVLTYPVPIVFAAGASAPVPLGVAPRQISYPVSSSSIDLALTLGGGVGVRVASRLSVDVDLRLIRLVGQADRNLGRFGVGVRYRF